MILKRFFPVLFFFVACTTTPAIKSFFIAPGVIQYFLPPTDWTTKNSRKIKARLDITYRTRTESPAAINISFINEDGYFRNVSSATLVGDGFEYALNDITVFFIDPVKHELRIGAMGDRDTLTRLLESNSIVLRALIDGAEYIFEHDKTFFVLKEQFLVGISL
jgi:hypothetical protein